ncbi:MAG: hypothetical protein BWY04_01108 [candidate division CPR1 bacterium ADurb.Bin160]|uniref:Uncharacterized protein n=1 Tax=candidate division CPR1 bacterium ADurb.Bin160 TaxID=1852826 RepID=A0A1V5ZLT6_9BACT|nr:MAG: hypothetical protein BWY04_01108 [candidate division CPR1 bacterium ADurb.Bin160]
MEKKYELIETNCNSDYRIKALKDFQLITGEMVKKGDLGGLVDGEHNLSQEGNCWISYYAGAFGKSSVKDNAILKDYSGAFDNSTVSGNAVMNGDSKAYDHSTISGNAVMKDWSRAYNSSIITENAVMQHNSCADGNSTVSGNAVMKDDSVVCGNSTVSGNAVMKDDSIVCGNSTVSGNAVMQDNSCAEGDSIITGNAVLQAYQTIRYGTVTTDLLGTKDWVGALYAELGVAPNDNKVVLYKKVWSTDDTNTFTSNYDRNFLYKIGETVVAENVNEDIFESCARGLHFTSLEFLNDYDGDAILKCEIDVPDIITVQEEKVRARRCKVLRVYKEE